MKKFNSLTYSPKKIKVCDITPNPDNPRTITKETLKGLKRSMETNGYADRIIIEQNGQILSGHARWCLFKEQDPQQEIEVLVCDQELTDAQRRRALIGLNAQGGKINIEEFQMKFADIAEEYGFRIDLSDEADDTPVEEVETPEVTEEEPQAKYGDIYQLGRHRLMCGSATEPEDIKKLMDGQLADMLLTDPPYNVDYKGSNGLKIQNDHMEDTKFQQFLTDAFNTANINMKAGASFYIWHADLEGYNFRKAAIETGWKIRECLQWVKNTIVLGRQDYQWRHEPCLYGWKDGTSHTWNGGRKQATTIEQIDFMNEEELRKAFKNLTEQIDNSVIYENKPTANKEHPTMKPIKLMARLIRNSSNQGQIVLDLFAGSGSTLLACEQTNRKCYCTELDPKYVDVIIKRWEQFTGQKAIKIKEGK